MAEYDVIVVGLGPAGATAAYELARRGHRVLALEQKRHPRYKPCGGCLSLKIDRILEPDFHPLIEKTVYGVSFTFEGVDPFRIRSDRPVAYMVMRDRSDQFLVEKAHRVGAEVREEERVTGIMEGPDRIFVRTTRAEYNADYVVGADGVNGIVARALRMVPERVAALCLEGEASYEDLCRELRGTAGLDLLRSLWPAPAEPDVGRHYDRVASRYDSRFGLWRELVAAGAWPHVERLLGGSVRDGARVLDAGTGTGAAIEALLRRASPGEVVGVDISKSMLRMARRKIKDPRVKFEVQDITSLPYPDCSFDVVLSTWTLETLPDPRQAVREFLRLIKDDGYVIYAFSSRPTAGLDRAYANLLERAYQGSLRWHLLGKEERPYHDCPHSSLTTFARGMATVVLLRKCCSVDAPDSPCLPGPVSGQGKG